MRAKLLWPVLVVALLAAAAVSVALAPAAHGPLDPASAAPDGSKALATVLDGYGVRVLTSRDAGTARGRVVVTDPDAYTSAQLRRLAARADLVLLGGTPRVLTALGASPVPLGSTDGGAVVPACAWPGARAAGAVEFPAGARRLRTDGADGCYGGAVLVSAHWIWLGSGRLVRNDTVARPGVAALAVNAITADRGTDRVTWLLPGSGATEQAAPTTWALFPDGARRAFVWLGVLGLLLALWKGRRLGGVVREPLPVLVRAAEVVEGHGRLYRRAGARERAGAALRTAAVNRLGARLDVPPGASAADVCAAVAERTGRPVAAVTATLLGPAPHDDAALVALADELAELEAAATVALPTRREGTT